MRSNPKAKLINFNCRMDFLSLLLTQNFISSKFFLCYVEKIFLGLFCTTNHLPYAHITLILDNRAEFVRTTFIIWTPSSGQKLIFDVMMKTKVVRKLNFECNRCPEHVVRSKKLEIDWSWKKLWNTENLII